MTLAANAAELEFAGRARTIRLASNFAPTRTDLIAAANISAVGFPVPKIRALALPGARSALSRLSEVLPASSITAAVASASTFLGPYGPLVGAAGTWLLGNVLGSFFAVAPPPPKDRAVLSKAGWIPIGTAPAAVGVLVDAHGWIVGGRMAGELMAAIGSVLGAAQIKNVGTAAGAELWWSPSGNFALVIGTAAPLAGARVRQLLAVEKKSAPSWIGKEVIQVDLSSGAIFQKARDLVLMDALRGLTVSLVQQALTGWGKMDPQMRALLYGPRGRVTASARWKTITPASSTFQPDCNSPGKYRDPYYQKHCTYKPGKGKTSAPVTVNMRNLQHEIQTTGLEPWRVDKIYELARDHHEDWPLELPRWDASGKGIRKPDGGVILPPAIYAHNASLKKWKTALVTAPFNGGPLAPWEPIGPPSRAKWRPELNQAVQERLRKWGPGAPAWAGRGSASWLSYPLSNSGATGWFPIEVAAPELAARGAGGAGGAPGGGAAILAAAAVLLFARR